MCISLPWNLHLYLHPTCEPGLSDHCTLKKHIKLPYSNFFTVQQSTVGGTVLCLMSLISYLYLRLLLLTYCPTANLYRIKEVSSSPIVLSTFLLKLNLKIPGSRKTLFPCDFSKFISSDINLTRAVYAECELYLRDCKNHHIRKTFFIASDTKFKSMTKI